MKSEEMVLGALRSGKDSTGKPNERQRTMDRKNALEFAHRWKINKALYKKYGGRVAFQQFGPEPIDAYRLFLKEREKAGDFRIIDKKYEPEFWEYFSGDSETYTIYSDVDGEEAINTPWWSKKESAEE